MANKFYLTTPIYYVNAAPHIGHSYTSIAADTLTRAMAGTLGRDNVWFLTGTDEHGQKIQKAAAAQGMTPLQFVDQIVPHFSALWKKLNVVPSDFIRTTQERHVKTVQRCLDIVKDKGLIYQSQYEGWYCTPCESFWMESQLLPGGLCPDCQRPAEKISETSYFFKLRESQQWLIDHIKSHPDFIRPQIRRNEVLGFLEGNELNDLCISRPKERLEWGIPLPFSPDHVTYVWFDALVNYISAVGSFDAKGVYSSPWWEKDTQVVHVIGKDILRHHTVYWPIMLKALGIRLPDTIFAHGWWMVGDSKMSKSKGNVVAPLDMVDKYGIDPYRYFLLRDVPFGMDGSFSEDSLVKRFNSDLANDLGNLVFRTLTMIEKYYQGQVPAIGGLDPQGRAILESVKVMQEEAPQRLAAASDFNFSAALQAIWERINMANKYVEETKPWNLAKEGKTEELKSFIGLLVAVIRAVAAEIEPFMPDTAHSIMAQIGRDTIAKAAPLFPRIDTKPKIE